MSRKRAMRKISEYGKQLAEKQKCKAEYGVREKQFSNYYKKASASVGITGEELLKGLELRLDNVLYRSGLYHSRKQARQAIVHGHICVDDKLVNIPSYQIGIHQEFKIKDPKNARLGEQEVAKWLKVDQKKCSGKVERLPEREESSQEIDEQLVVEFYSR